MGPKRGAGTSSRGRVRRGRGVRTPLSSRGGRRGAPSTPSSSSRRRFFGAMISFYASIAGMPLAFYCLLHFLLLFFSAVLMASCFVFKGALDLLLMLSWRSIVPA